MSSGDGAADGDQVVTVTAVSAAATQEVGARLGRLLRAGDLLVLSGELGAGKTTFTQGVAEGLGVRGPITSPTFVLSRIHPTLVGGPALVHVDAYRLASPRDVDDLDLDATAADAVTVVEWGAGMVEQLAEERLEVGLSVRADETRSIALRGVGARWAAVVGAL